MMLKNFGGIMIHNTRKGPGRSINRKGMTRTRIEGQAGSKLGKKIHLGLCGLRHGVGPAGRLALEGKLCKKNEN